MSKMNIVLNAQVDLAPEGSLPLTHYGNFYHHLLYGLGYPAEAPPVADLLRRYHGLEGQWLIASPIHWIATHNDAMIVSTGDDLKLSEEESRTLFQSFADYFLPEKMPMHYHDSHIWLIQVNDKPIINAQPVHTMLGQSIFHSLQQLDRTLFWQRFITESQMLFSQQALNKTRENFPINGVWVWGAGQLNPTETKLIIHSDRLIRLAQCLSSRVTAYQHTSLYHKNSLLMLEPTSFELTTLNHLLKKYTLHWYWNNRAYITHSTNPLLRLWRRYAN